MKWHYSKGGQTAGPVEAEEIGELLRTGELTQADHVWNETIGQEWKPISEVPAFGTMYGSPGEEREAGKLKVAKREESPDARKEEVAAMVDAMRSVSDVGLPKEPRRGPFTPNCPECGRAMKRWYKPENHKFRPRGVVPLLVSYAFAPYACDRCGTATFTELKGTDKLRSLSGSLALVVTAIVVLIALIMFLVESD